MLTLFIFSNTIKDHGRNSLSPMRVTITNELHSVDGALIAKLRESGQTDIHSESSLCELLYGNCWLRCPRRPSLAREKAKEQKKLMLWKSRVNLIKKARQSMQEKAFSDAAVAYEKYIKVLEVVFDCKQGELTPEQFKDSARTQELTIVASVYWDLLANLRYQ